MDLWLGSDSGLVPPPSPYPFQAFFSLSFWLLLPHFYHTLIIARHMLHGTSSLTARWPFDSICRSINFRKKSPLHLHFSQREYSPVFSRSSFSLAFYRGSLGQPFSHFSISQHSACLALKLFHLLFNLLYPLARGVLFRFGLVFVCMCVYAPVASVSGSGWEVRSPRAHKSVSVSAGPVKIHFCYIFYEHIRADK